MGWVLLGALVVVVGGFGALIIAGVLCEVATSDLVKRIDWRNDDE